MNKRKREACVVCGGPLPWKKVSLCSERCAERWCKIRPKGPRLVPIPPETVAAIRTDRAMVLPLGMEGMVYHVWSIPQLMEKYRLSKTIIEDILHTAAP